MYDNADIHFNIRNHKNNKNELLSSGKTFLSAKTYNGHTYHLCRCKECVGKKFPQIYKSKSLYAQNFAKYAQYAYDVLDKDFNIYTLKRQSVTKEKMIQKALASILLEGQKNLEKVEMLDGEGNILSYEFRNSAK